MNPISTEQIAWLAGIYEGEGCCTIRGKSSYRVEIVMTDKDVIERVFGLVGEGSFRTLPQRNQYKMAYLWSIGSQDGIDFLQAIRPWLGERRGQRVDEVVDRWYNKRVARIPGSNKCMHGHAIDPSPQGKVVACPVCKSTAQRKYRDRKKAEKLALVSAESK